MQPVTISDILGIEIRQFTGKEGKVIMKPQTNLVNHTHV